MQIIIKIFTKNTNNNTNNNIYNIMAISMKSNQCIGVALRLHMCQALLAPDIAAREYLNSYMQNPMSR